MDLKLSTAVASGMGAIIAGVAMEPAQALERLGAEPHLVCHGSFLIERLGVAAQAPRATIRAAREQQHYDVAELFAFVCPARFATPTPMGWPARWRWNRVPARRKPSDASPMTFCNA